MKKALPIIKNSGNNSFNNLIHHWYNGIYYNIDLHTS